MLLFCKIKWNGCEVQNLETEEKRKMSWGASPTPCAGGDLIPPGARNKKTGTYALAALAKRVLKLPEAFFF